MPLNTVTKRVDAGRTVPLVGWPDHRFHSASVDWVWVELPFRGRATEDALFPAQLEHVNWPEKRADGSIMKQLEAFCDHESPTRDGCCLLHLLDLLSELRKIGAFGLLLTRHAGWAMPLLEPEYVLLDDLGPTQSIAQRRGHSPLTAASGACHTDYDD